MNFNIGLLVFTLLAGCFAAPRLEVPEDDMSIFFDHTDPTDRIVGGTEAAVGSHPHMVALTNGVAFRSFFCGGSLISQRSILTAAHCIPGVFSWGALTPNVRATVGTNRWNTGGFTYTLDRNVSHPHYVSDVIKNDIAILITTSNVELSELVRPVPITYSTIPGGVRTRVAGWGRTRAGGSVSPTLQELFPTTLAGNDCEERIARAADEFYVSIHVQSHIEICTFQAVNFGTCNGDSGSALLDADSGQQIGIVSWGFSCALGAPDVFVRMSGYRDWLPANIV